MDKCDLALKRAGMILSKGIEGLVKPDHEKAKLYFEKAAAIKQAAK